MEDLIFHQASGLPTEVYDDGEFEKYDKYSSEDLIKGKMYNGSQFEMAEVLTEQKEPGDSYNKKYSTIFNGLLAKVETTKPFNSCLYLRKDVKDQNFLVRLFSGKKSFDKLRVEVEPKEFEKIFDVFTSNQEILAKLFTPEIKQMLMDFQSEMKMEFEITIKNNNLYIRFWTGKMFEAAKLSKYSLDRENLLNYYRIVVLIFELTNKMVDLLDNVQYEE